MPIIDWSYAYDPTSFFKSLGKSGDWYDLVHGDNSQFINFKKRNPDLVPSYVYFDYFSYEGIDNFQIAMCDRRDLSVLGKAILGRYSNYDVLDPDAGEIHIVPKPTREVHPLSPIRPLVAWQRTGLVGVSGYQENGTPYSVVNPNRTAEATGFYLFDNMKIARSGGACPLEEVDAIIRRNNLGFSTVDTTGQLDLLHPPGYSSESSTGVVGVPYITSWEKFISQDDSKEYYRFRWSSGKEEVVTIQDFSGANKNAVATLGETVKSERISYVESGLENPSTVNAIPVATADTKLIYAKSTLPGHEPWKAFNNNNADGWLSADGDTDNVWLVYDFGSTGKVLNKWRFQAHPTVPNCSPKRFIIEGSNSPSWLVWDLLDAKHATAPYKPLNLGEWSDWFTFNNGTSYQYYRFYILESYANG